MIDLNLHHPEFSMPMELAALLPVEKSDGMNYALFDHFYESLGASCKVVQACIRALREKGYVLLVRFQPRSVCVARDSWCSLREDVEAYLERVYGEEV